MAEVEGVGTWAADLVQKVEKLVPPTITSGKPGFVLSDKPLTEYDQRVAIPSPVEVETLGSLVDLLEQKAIDIESLGAVLHIFSPTEVRVITKTCDNFGRRHIRAKAVLPKLAEFPFGQWQGHEAFMIALLTLFVNDAAEGVICDRDYVLQMAQQIDAGNTITTADDGITQTAVIKSGAALKSQVTLKNRVLLSPYRTFRDAVQPQSEFVFRVKQGGDGKAQLSLTESDGGAWRITAMRNLKTWLTNALKAQGVENVPVIA